MSLSSRCFAAAARSYLRLSTLGRLRGLATMWLLLRGVGQSGCEDQGEIGQSLPQDIEAMFPGPPHLVSAAATSNTSMHVTLGTSRL